MPIAKDNAPSIRDLASESFFRCVNWVNRVNLFKKRERIEILKIFDKLAPKKILDFGCRDGFLSSIIQEHTQAEVYGTDIDMEAMDRGARDYPNVKFVLPSAVETMNPEFDVIFMGHVLEHVQSCEEVLGSLNQVLAPRGKFIITVPQERVKGDTLPHLIIFESIKNKRFVNPHVRVIRRKELQKIVSKHGLTIEDYLYINALPPFSSRHLLWPTAYSLVATCGRSFHPNSTQQQ